MHLSTLTSTHDVPIEIGDIPICVRTGSSDFARLLRDRYGDFVNHGSLRPSMELDVTLLLDSDLPVQDGEGDVEVRMEAGRWVMERGDFRAEWDPECRRGWVRQTPNPYAIDSVLRILHSLLLARSGGFLIHAATAVRNNRAYVFAGESGVGKTTLSRLAPADVTILTDEISYLKAREKEHGIKEPRSPFFEAFGTPFAGELAQIGKKTRAPLAGLFLLKQGPENRVESMNESEAAWELFRHVLFFARDGDLVQRVFQNILEFVGTVPIRRLVFKADASAWELIA